MSRAQILPVPRHFVFSVSKSNHVSRSIKDWTFVRPPFGSKFFLFLDNPGRKIASERLHSCWAESSFWIICLNIFFWRGSWRVEWSCVCKRTDIHINCRNAFFCRSNWFHFFCNFIFSLSFHDTCPCIQCEHMKSISNYLLAHCLFSTAGIEPASFRGNGSLGGVCAGIASNLWKRRSGPQGERCSVAFHPAKPVKVVGTSLSKMGTRVSIACNHSSNMCFCDADMTSMCFKILHALIAPRGWAKCAHLNKTWSYNGFATRICTPFFLLMAGVVAEFCNIFGHVMTALTSSFGLGGPPNCTIWDGYNISSVSHESMNWLIR